MRTDDVPECTREGVLKKSWKFYRRTGAIWTDGYHMPEHQRRWSERADLDAKHEAHVRRQMRREARSERDRKADVKLRSKKIRSRLHLRQVENAERYGSLASPPQSGKTRRNSVHDQEKRSNHCSCDQGRGSKCTCKNRHHDSRDDKRWARERHSDNREAEATRMANRKDQARTILAGKHARAPQRMHKLKTQDYYRGNGFLWSDMTHVPYERLHLVLDPRIIDKDREALERIDRRLQEEAEENYQRACDMQRKIDIQRDQFRAQQDRNDHRASSAGLHVPQRLGRVASETQKFKGDYTAGDQALPGDQEQIMENQEARAVPRLLGHPAAGKGAPVSEKSGLLHIDHVASRRLDHLWSLTASMKKRAGGKPGSAPGRQESVPDGLKVRDVDRQVMFVSAPLGSASVAPGGEESIVFATRYDSDTESKEYCDGESDSDSDSDSEPGRNTLPFKEGVAPCQSLSAPAVVFLELDDFESRLRELEASGETRRPFWMDGNEKN